MRFVNKNELFLLEEIVKRNFTSKYKDSVLGILWTVLRPLAVMMIFTIIFSTIFQRNIENYPVYFLCGRCIFNFFSTSVNFGLNAIKGNSIIQKTPAPKYIFVLGAVISEFLTFIIEMIILVGVIIFTNAPIYSTAILGIIPIISLLAMVIGLALMLSIMCVYYTDIKHLWGILSMLLMYASAVFYPMDIIPEPFHQYMILNPLFWIIDQFRCFVYYGVIPQTSYIMNSLLLSSIILVLGIIIFKKYENQVAMKL